MPFSYYLIPFIEIMMIALVINYLLRLFWATRVMDVIFGFLILLFIFLIANWLDFPVLEKITLNVFNVGILAVVIIFQPEIRLALSKLRLKGKKYGEIHEFDLFLDNLTHSVYRLSEKHIGALIVLENQDSFKDYASSFVSINAIFSSELLESFFMTTTPLHDGAVVIRESTILAAGTILPLAQETSQLSKSMGTRHRAALGASQKTDALIIAISEETGKVSIAREGILTSGIKNDRFRGIVKSVFAPPVLQKKFKIWNLWS